MKILKGFYKGVDIAVPEASQVRPTVDHLKKNILKMMEGRQFEIVWDLFAGSGGVGLEFLSQGARQVVFVEQLSKAVSCLRLNLAECQMKNPGQMALQETCVVTAAAENFLSSPGNFGVKSQPDLVFLDPPYGQAWMKKIVPKLMECPLIGARTLILAEHVVEDPFEATAGAGLLKQEVYRPKVLTLFRKNQ